MRKITAPVNLDQFTIEHRLEKTRKYEGMIDLINDMVDTKQQVMTYDCYVSRVNEEREESRLVLREVHDLLSDPRRFAAKQEVK